MLPGEEAEYVQQAQALVDAIPAGGLHNCTERMSSPFVRRHGSPDFEHAKQASHMALAGSFAGAASTYRLC